MRAVDWKASYERLGRVLNAEAREHYEIVEALGLEPDASAMEDDDAFHARVLRRIHDLRKLEFASGG